MPGFKKILIVDDDIITVTICERMMKISNFAEEVVRCSDGQQAREYLLKNISQPDVILLDLHMGIMNGWEFLEWYQKWTPAFNNYAPVYVLSSSLSQEDSKRSQAYEQVKGYIVKPITIDHLNEITCRFLS
jgi:CheY-like chemotaxis protein